MESTRQLLQLVEQQRAFANDITLVLGAYIELAPYLEKYDDKEHLEEIETYMKEDLSSRIEIQHNALALDFVLQRVPALAGNIDVDRVMQMYKDRFQELRASLRGDAGLLKSDEYVEFKRAVWNVKHPDEPMPVDEDGDDIAVMLTGDDNLICPLSRTELKEPMKNEPCGHVFSKEPLLAYIKGRNFDCPVAGCRAHITMGSIVPDAATQRKLNNKKRKRTRTDEDVTDL